MTGNDDKRFALMCNWLRANGYKLRSRHTAKSDKRKPVVYLIDKATNKVVGSA